MQWLLPLINFQIYHYMCLMQTCKARARLVNSLLPRLISGLVPENDVHNPPKPPKRFLAVLSGLCPPAGMINLLRAQPWTTGMPVVESSSVVHSFPLHPIIFSKLSQELSSHLKGNAPLLFVLCIVYYPYILKSKQQALQIGKMPWFLEITMWNLQYPPPWY